MHFGNLGLMEMAILLPIALVLWVLPAAAGIWAFFAILRMNKTLGRIEQQLDERLDRLPDRTETAR